MGPSPSSVTTGSPRTTIALPLIVPIWAPV
jgi:hypothetical protein